MVWIKGESTACIFKLRTLDFKEINNFFGGKKIIQNFRGIGALYNKIQKFLIGFSNYIKNQQTPSRIHYLCHQSPITLIKSDKVTKKRIFIF